MMGIYTHFRCKNLMKRWTGSRLIQVTKRRGNSEIPSTEYVRGGEQRCNKQNHHVIFTKLSHTMNVLSRHEPLITAVTLPWVAMVAYGTRI